VSLLVDGASKGSLTAPPYTFSVTLTDGAHVLRVVAQDAASNQGEAQVAVTVSTGAEPPPGTLGMFGAKCDSHATCQSGVCGNLEGDLFCTQSCDPSASPCPLGAECLPGGDEGYLCGPPTGGSALDGEGEVLVGGCAVGPGARPAGLGLPLLGLALLWLVTRRRRPEP
jgi:MYXO-CTERM domain-containing protein